ncbi:hypothetical protein RRG08_019794 [Elysia crispata]|uniref:Uncharacterized protein n=1 Tax=Elysia crispata TaxID=231223 RepID=A0AAE1E5D1_9GAST|nr:hypothetical protein RRG08_019794 [Elysia crispata]
MRRAAEDLLQLISSQNSCRRAGTHELTVCCQCLMGFACYRLPVFWLEIPPLSETLTRTNGAIKQVTGTDLRSSGPSLSETLTRTNGAIKQVTGTDLRSSGPPLSETLTRTNGAIKQVTGTDLRSRIMRENGTPAHPCLRH